MYTFNPTLYFITDSTGLSEEEFLYRVECALDGGATLIQLREKDRTTREYIHLAYKVHSIARRYNVPLIVDDRVDVALAVGTEGVHVGQTDMPVSIARKLMGEQAVLAEKRGADYLGVGAIYPTTTKVKTVLTTTDTLRDICAAVPIPVNAIGGLNKTNLDVLTGIPIAGICVVSAIMKSDNPCKSAHDLLILSKQLQNKLQNGK